MGQKVNPIGFRVGITRNWASTWFATKGNYADMFKIDSAMRKYIEKNFPRCGISGILIEIVMNRCSVVLRTAKPGFIIGEKGSRIEFIRKKLCKIANMEVSLSIAEIRRPDLDAKLLAEGVAIQIEKRIRFRRAMKRAAQSAMKSGAAGVAVTCGGRLDGAAIAREEKYREGKISLHTLRANVDYGYCPAKTISGIIGIKVWLYTGHIYDVNAVFLPKKSENKRSS